MEKKRLRDRFDDIIHSDREYDNLNRDIVMEGCGSFCDESCSAYKDGACSGCTRCDYFNNCPDGGCEKCYVRCGQRDDVVEWCKDVDGLLFDDVKCRKPYTNKKLPFFIPQVRRNFFREKHPAVLVSLSNFLTVQNNKIRWLYRRSKRIREALSIPSGVKMILHFYAKDDLLEFIWGFKDSDWGDGKNFWEILAEYGFDAAISVNYSCFSNQPRMEHVINMKRNVLSASYLANVGIPVIQDLMWHLDEDLFRLVLWGKQNNIKVYSMNFQTARRGEWVANLIKSSLAKVFSVQPDARVIINGVANKARIVAVNSEYSGRISISNMSAFIKSMACLQYDEKSNAWLKTNMTKQECWHETLKMYKGWGK